MCSVNNQALTLVLIKLYLHLSAALRDQQIPLYAQVLSGEPLVNYVNKNQQLFKVKTDCTSVLKERVEKHVLGRVGTTDGQFREEAHEVEILEPEPQASSQ